MLHGNLGGDGGAIWLLRDGRDTRGGGGYQFPKKAGQGTRNFHRNRRQNKSLESN
jgi:hypothetical protein